MIPFQIITHYVHTKYFYISFCMMIYDLIVIRVLFDNNKLPNLMLGHSGLCHSLLLGWVMFICSQKREKLCIVWQLGKDK